MAQPITISSAPIDVHNGSIPRSISVYTVPTGFTFAIDSIDVVTLTVTAPGTPAVVTIGNTGSATAYEATHLQNTFAYLSSTAAEKQTAASGTAITATITANSTATAESAVIAINGYLLANTGTTPNPPAPPSGAGIYAYFYTVDAGGNVETGKVLSYALSGAPAGSGLAYDSTPQMVTSDGTGLVQIEIVPGATYKVWSGLNAPVCITIPLSPANPYPLPDMTFSS